jgi:hypothetical protein
MINNRSIYNYAEVIRWPFIRKTLFQELSKRPHASDPLHSSQIEAQETGILPQYSLGAWYLPDWPLNWETSCA